jgi:hypothetical protein
MEDSIAPDTPVRTAGPMAWLREGLRASVLLRPRVPAAAATPWTVGILLLSLTLLELVLGRMEVPGPATFELRGWLVPWWSTALLLFVAWWVLAGGALSSWFALWTGALVPATLVSYVLGIAAARGALPEALTTQLALWLMYLSLWAWTILIAVRLSRALGAPSSRLPALVLCLLAIYAGGAWLFPDRAWVAERDTQAEAPPPRLQLSQEVFESQQDLWTKTVQSLAPQRPGVVDVYALVFAPYAEEDVFLRESTMVAGVLAERFDAGGRLIQLVNHADTAQQFPWATPRNLERAVQALAERMDSAEDVLVVYLTSHGANDHRLAASHGNLQVPPVSPGELRRALDNAGVRHRVIAVSACYSGGWLGPLESSTTLMMTAADATHTSYGCGRLSPLTFFGRAVFDEQLRKTHSFELAFAAAVPVIAQREKDAGKSDGFSNPQISVGEGIRPVLRTLEQRLQQAQQR